MAELMIPPETRAEHYRGLANYLATGVGPVINERVEMTALRSDGTTFPIELAVTAIEPGDKTFFIGFVRDISERIRSQLEIQSQAREIEEERARLAYAQELAGTGSWSFDVPSQTLTLSDEFFRLAGYEPNAFEVTWTNFLECMHWEDRPLVISADMFDGDEPQSPRDNMVRVHRPNGETRFMLSRTRAIYDQEGVRIRVEGTLADVTDRKKAEQDLERFFSLSLDMLSISSMDGYFKRINVAFERTLGYTISELLSQPTINFVHPDDRPATMERIKELSMGRPVTGFTNRFRCKDGSHRWMLWTTAPFQDLLYSVTHDVTPLREA